MVDAQTGGLERPNTPVSTLLDVRGVALRLGQQLVLDNVSFAFGEGSRVALLGPNGAGKSSLIRLISGELAPLSGNITVAGFAAGTADAKRRIGLIPQRLSLFPNLSTHDNLYYFAQLCGLSASDARSRAREALDWVDLVDRSEDRVGQLSGGMQRRLSIACGAIHQPALLVADEPLVGIDARQRKPVEQLLVDLLKRGTTVLETTHDLRRVLGAFDEVIVLKGGKLAASGRSESIASAIRALPHRCYITLEPSQLSRSFSYAGFRVTENRLTGVVADPGRELSNVLAAVEQHGLNVRDIKVEPPGIDAYMQKLSSHPDGESTCSS